MSHTGVYSPIIDPISSGGGGGRFAFAASPPRRAFRFAAASAQPPLAANSSSFSTAGLLRRSGLQMPAYMRTARLFTASGSCRAAASIVSPMARDGISSNQSHVSASSFSPPTTAKKYLRRSNLSS